MDKKPNEQNGLILESSLQCFFFDQLNEVNKKSFNPLPNETIYYSSIVMDQFGDSENFFVKSDEGKVSEKVLGTKLLESSKLPRQKQVRELRDIADTALFLCGYFSDSLNKKIVDTSYYQQIGQSAYQKLNAFVPDFFEVSDFYKLMSSSFHPLSMMMNVVSKKFDSNGQDEMTLFVGNGFKIKAS